MEFTESEAKFLKNEFGLTQEDVAAMDESSLDKLYEDCVEIEVEEACAASRGGGDISERGRMAADMVDVIHGPYDSSEFDEEMAGIDVLQSATA